MPPLANDPDSLKTRALFGSLPRKRQPAGLASSGGQPSPASGAASSRMGQHCGTSLPPLHIPHSRRPVPSPCSLRYQRLRRLCVLLHLLNKRHNRLFRPMLLRHPLRRRGLRRDTLRRRRIRVRGHAPVQASAERLHRPRGVGRQHAVRGEGDGRAGGWVEDHWLVLGGGPAAQFGALPEVAKVAREPLNAGAGALEDLLALEQRQCHSGNLRREAISGLLRSKVNKTITQIGPSAKIDR
mmetsp:Transcript_88991/g.203550  ORF Transcript_88991/g.203550 Transcript_88991/m.203550 type:complete len:240 (-) Transcript_88991:663-1382(-)